VSECSAQVDQCFCNKAHQSRHLHLTSALFAVSAGFFAASARPSAGDATSRLSDQRAEYLVACVNLASFHLAMTTHTVSSLSLLYSRLVSVCAVVSQCTRFPPADLD